MADQPPESPQLPEQEDKTGTVRTFKLESSPPNTMQLICSHGPYCPHSHDTCEPQGSTVLTFSQDMDYAFTAWMISSFIVAETYNPPVSKAVWDSIFMASFSDDVPYILECGSFLTSGRDDIIAYHVPRVPLGDWHFLLVEFTVTPRGIDISDDTWAAAVEEVTQYLRKFSSGLNRKYGIVAIGKSIRFYEVVGEEPKDFEVDGTRYWLHRQCRTITDRLRWIWDNHVPYDLSGIFFGGEYSDHTGIWRGFEAPQEADKSCQSPGPNESDREQQVIGVARLAGNTG